MIWGNWFRLFGRKREPYVSPFWSGALGPRQPQQNEDVHYVESVECFDDLGEDLLQVMVDNESHVVVYGAMGTGKTTLMRSCLRKVPPGYSALVFDVGGGYEGFTDYHALYPINPVELVPHALHSVVDEVLKIAGVSEALSSPMIYNAIRCMTWLTNSPGPFGPPQSFDTRRFSRDFTGLFRLCGALVEEGVVASDDANSIKALLRRLFDMHHWAINSPETHPLIKKFLSGGLRGKSIGIDLRPFRFDIQRWFYIIALLKAIELSDLTNVIIVIDEAHLFLHSPASTLASLVRVGRNRRVYFALISQAPQDFPSSIWSTDKIFIEFPIPFISFMDVLRRRPSYKYALGEEDEPGIRTKAELEEHWRDIHTAMAIIKPTTPKMKECLGAGMTMMPVKVDVNIQPKPEAVTLRKCAEKYGVPLELVWERGFGWGEVVRAVWECIGSP
jgi:hypothetical protein